MRPAGHAAIAVQACLERADGAAEGVTVVAIVDNVAIAGRVDPPWTAIQCLASDEGVRAAVLRLQPRKCIPTAVPQQALRWRRSWVSGGDLRALLSRVHRSERTRTCMESVVGAPHEHGGIGEQASQPSLIM